MTDEALIEATARAICEERTWIGAWEKANNVERDAWRRDARAALAVIRPAVVKECALVVDEWAKVTFPAPEKEAQDLAAAIRALAKG